MNTENKSSVDTCSEYRPPELSNEIQLQLSRNESTSILPTETWAGVSPECVSRYPSMEPLQLALADFLDVASDRIVISAGGDDALERAIRLAIADGSPEILSHEPSFEMIDIYTLNHGGNRRQIRWDDGPFPTEAFLNQFSADTGLAIVVSPNNPTGQTVATDDLLRIADQAQSSGAFLLVDNAYIEFADEDPSQALFSHPNILVLRTFSKAWGMAGLRTGYLIAPNAKIARRLRNATGPFPVSGLSLELAELAIRSSREAMRNQVNRIKHYRGELTRMLRQLGVDVGDSQGNFLLLKSNAVENGWRTLGASGIATRIFPDNALLKNRIRITVPSQAADLLHLAKSLNQLFDGNFDLSQLAVDSPSEPATEFTASSSPERTASVSRKTRETDIEIQLNIDGTGQTDIETGIGFLDHMLTAFAFHSRFDLKLHCRGDLHIDDHHTAEDCALALGAAIDQALGKRSGIVRFAHAYAPLDEALARTVLDLSGRPWPSVSLDLQRETIGEIATENLVHVFISLAMSLKCSLHVDVLRGDNDHHKTEAAFKSLALAMRQAVARSGGDVPSTKGVL